MDKSNKISKAFEELATELGGLNDVVSELKELKETIIDSNEELIATFIEGTKRIVKKPERDQTQNLKSLEKNIIGSIDRLVNGLTEIKSVSSEVEKGVKSIKMPSGTDFRATGSMLKLPIKELTRAVNDFDLSLPRDAKDPIAVRLSDGENFYKALENVIQQISGGGGASSYAFDKQDSSPTKAATVQKTINGKVRDAIVVVNSDGSNIGGDTDSEGRISVRQIAPTATVTSVNDTNVSTTLLSANTDRVGASIYNDSTVDLYIKLGTIASTTDFTVILVPDAYFEVFGGYTGRIDGIWSSNASGSARITELT